MLAVERDGIEAARDFEPSGDPRFRSARGDQAELNAGNVDRAAELTQRALSAHGQLNNNRSSASAANYLAGFALATNRIEDARSHMRDSLTLLRANRHPLLFAEAIEYTESIAEHNGDATCGSRLRGFTATPAICVDERGCNRI